MVYQGYVDHFRLHQSYVGQADVWVSGGQAEVWASGGQVEVVWANGGQALVFWACDGETIVIWTMVAPLALLGWHCIHDVSLST